MGNQDDKYGRNRNLWRKVIQPVRRPPDIRTIIDTINAVTYSLDLSKVVRDRNFFAVLQNQTTGALGLVLGEYDEGLISFDNQSEKSVTFNFTFSNSPIVVFTMEEAYSGVPNSENIGIFGFSSSTTGSHLGVSAPFSGTIRYRAAFAAAYPSYFQSSFAPASGTFRASAGNLTPNESFYTASYATLAGAPTSFRQTPFDSGYTHLADVKLDVVGTPGASSAISDITAHLPVPVHYIAYE